MLTKLGLGELVKGVEDGNDNIYEMRSVQKSISFNGEYLPISQPYPFIAPVELRCNARYASIII